MQTPLFWVYLVPAVVAFAFKVGLFGYAFKHRPLNGLTRVYVFLLAALTVQNLVIISSYSDLAEGTVPVFEANIFYVATIFAIGLILHLAITVALPRKGITAAIVVRGAYFIALALTLLILNTPWVISGYEITNHVITRVPGPMYPLFGLYAAGSLLAGVGLLIYGAVRQETRQMRLKNQLLVLALIPMQLAMLSVLVLLQFGYKHINLSILSPILITYLLVVTAYATHQHRLFDIQFYLPWSSVRKRKTAFYQRLRAMVSELADIQNVNQAVNLLADALHCPVALISGPRPVLAISGNSAGLARFPVQELRAVDHIVVANEIQDQTPRRYALMRQYGVGAIVPYYPHSQSAASWMLLGDNFSEQVYTPLDFKMVEQVFDRLGELFLDKLLFMRSQLLEAREQMQTLQFRLDISEERNKELQKRVRELYQQPEPPAAPRDRGARLKRVKHTEPAPILTLVPKSETQEGKTLDESVAEFESRLIKQTLERCGGNQSRAARILGLRPNTLFYKIERYGLGSKKSRD